MDEHIAAYAMLLLLKKKKERKRKENKRLWSRQWLKRRKAESVAFRMLRVHEAEGTSDTRVMARITFGDEHEEDGGTVQDKTCVEWTSCEEYLPTPSVSLGLPPSPVPSSQPSPSTSVFGNLNVSLDEDCMESSLSSGGNRLSSIPSSPSVTASKKTSKLEAAGTLRSVTAKTPVIRSKKRKDRDTGEDWTDGQLRRLDQYLAMKTNADKLDVSMGQLVEAASSHLPYEKKN